MWSLEIISSILAALLSASGVFVSSGVIELIQKIWKRGSTSVIRDRRHDHVKGVLKDSDTQEIVIPASSGSRLAPFYAVILVALVFAISIGVVWALTHIGGPLEATVNATIAKAGGSILIVGGGLFAAFFAVAFMAFVAIRFFSDKFDR
jgi:hypothetical protein